MRRMKIKKGDTVQADHRGVKRNGGSAGRPAG